MDVNKFINKMILEKFNLKLSEKTDTWVEYKDSLRVLRVDLNTFHYYFINKETYVPVSPDIIRLVDIIREHVLHAEPKYDILTDDEYEMFVRDIGNVIEWEKVGNDG